MGSVGVAAARRGGVVALFVLVPWLWFLARDSLGWMSDLGWTALPALAVLAVVAAAVRRRSWALRGLAVSLVVLTAVAVVSPWMPDDRGAVAPGAGVRVVGANVTARADAADTLLDLAPDVLVISEMDEKLADPLAAEFPHRVDAAAGPGVAVLSRLPVHVTDAGGPDLPGLRAEVEGPAGPFVLYALHVPRPWWTTRGGYQVLAPEHSRLVEVLARRVAAERLPVLVVGDLNSADRTGEFRRLLATGGLVDAGRAGWGGPTSVGKWRPLLARIDHVLVSAGWCGDDPSRPVLRRSDHRGVAATVGPCAPVH